MCTRYSLLSCGTTGTTDITEDARGVEAMAASGLTDIPVGVEELVHDNKEGAHGCDVDCGKSCRVCSHLSVRLCAGLGAVAVDHERASSGVP